MQDDVRKPEAELSKAGSEEARFVGSWQVKTKKGDGIV